MTPADVEACSRHSSFAAQSADIAGVNFFIVKENCSLPKATATLMFRRNSL